MPIADVTYHSNQGADIPVFGGGGWGPNGVLPPQIGDSEQVDFSAGARGGAVQSAQVTAMVLADTACRVVVGEAAGASDGAPVLALGTVAKSRKIVPNIPEAFSVPAGQRVVVRPL